MALLEDVPDMAGRKRLKPSILETAYVPHNSITNKLFVEDSTLNFQIGECKANEVLFAKGHESDPSLGSYAIISENYYLKIVLHEINNTNSLVFKSNNPILQTRTRKLITLKFNSTTKNLRLLLESVDEALSIDTSQAHYRTALNQFTGLKQSTDNIQIGRGVTLPHGTFGLYYLNAEKKEETQLETNEKYQVIKDERTLPELDNILFVTDRVTSPYPVFEMYEDGSNFISKNVYTNDSVYPKYARFNDIDYLYTSPNNLVFFYNGVKYISPTHTNLCAGDYNSTGSKVYFLSFFGATGTLKEALTSLLPTVTFNNSSISSNIGIYQINCHPSNNDKILISTDDNNGANPMYLAELDLTTSLRSTRFTLPYTSGAVDVRNQIYNIKYSVDGTKIGFNCYYARSGSVLSDQRAYMMSSDGTNLTLLGNNIEFCAFSPDTSKVLFSKVHTGTGYTNKKQLFIRDLTTNEETQITFHNSNNYMADWKA